MAKTDLLQRFIFENAPIRGEFIHLEESFQTIIQQHAYPEPIRRLLGEALSVAGLLSAIIKFTGRLTVQFRGKGKLKLLLAQCDNQFHLRGLVKWDGDLSYEDLMESFNEGVLVIMLDSGLKNRYQGIVSWRGHSLVESIEGYFRESEQLATKIWLSVNETQAAGFLLQIIPTAKKETVTVEQDNMHLQWERVTKQTALHLNKQTLFNSDYQTVLSELYPEEEIRVFSSVPVSFQCGCSRKRGEDAILVLGQEEAEAEIKDKQTIVVTCDFCNAEYIFDRIDVDQLFRNKDQPPTNIHLH